MSAGIDPPVLSTVVEILGFPGPYLIALVDMLQYFVLRFGDLLDFWFALDNATHFVFGL